MFLTCCNRFVNTSIFFFTEKSITCEEKYFSSHVRKIFHTLLSKSHLAKTLPHQHTNLINAIQEKLRKTFCCYNCLDLYHAQSFFQVFVTCFPSSLKQEQCLEKVTNSRPTASNLHNLFSTQYSCSQELGKKVTHTWKNFSHGKSRQLQQQNSIPEAALLQQLNVSQNQKSRIRQGPSVILLLSKPSRVILVVLSAVRACFQDFAE